MKILALMFLPLLLVACAHPQPGEPPGTAAMTTIKNFLAGGAVAVSTAKALLPSFACTPASKPGSSCLDQDDLKTADTIMNDIGTVRDSLSTRLAAYDHFDTKNAEEVKQAARDALATLKDLHTKGVDHIKNPQSKAQVDAVFNAVQGIVDMILNTTQPAAP